MFFKKPTELTYANVYLKRALRGIKRVRRTRDFQQIQEVILNLRKARACLRLYERYEEKEN